MWLKQTEKSQVVQRAPMVKVLHSPLFMTKLSENADYTYIYYIAQKIS